MSTKHTPGPWTVERGDWSEEGNVRFEIEGIKVFKAADARLISAAPDLLESLRTTATFLQSATLIMDKGSRQMALETVAEARAAIAKATGEEA
ncbi:hypothetical protein AWB76_06274 [Caballeronia temeraria]|uniref:Uncharacterized protein n=1 Tax=Caballeronia temeraria TaxID=1777137 RepID=A0A158D0A9_9BURK|nr:hypothetical protein [Caballeronia temeraria]SAK88062.1 hypothetical protein AWB76_06274 [Caballeronia temeraria]